MRHVLRLLVSAALCLGARAAVATEILIPAYFDPIASATEWNRIATAVDQSYKITTIINPFNGPLAANNPLTPAWLQVTDRVNCGTCGSALGFVYTRYGARPIDEVKADIRAYRDQGYDLSGIFIDELPSQDQLLGRFPGPLGSQAEYVAYYSELYRFIKEDIGRPNWRVVANPGTNTGEVFFTGEGIYGRSADSLVVLEQTGDFLLNGYVPSAWNANYTNDIGYIIHSTGANQFDDVLARISSNGGNIVYITNGAFPEFGIDARYSQLTGYWDRLLATADRCEVPEPATMVLLGIGIAGFAFTRRRRLAAA